MFICVAIAAGMLTAAPLPERHLRHRHRATAAAASHHRPAGSADLVLRRRIGRLLHLAQLEQRERDLHYFLIRVRTETRALIDDEVHTLDVGLQIGPAVVTRDFLGNPIIRAQIHNLQPHAVFALIEAQVRSNDGHTGSAAVALSLAAGDNRIIELACPNGILPSALTWTATAL